MRAEASTAEERSSARATLAWQARARSLVVAHSTSPIAAVRAYALLGIAQYGAAVAADERSGAAGSAEPGADAGGRAHYEARRGAIGAASLQVLSYLYPSGAAAMEQQLADESLGPNGRTHPEFARGMTLGRAVGDHMVAWARGDGFDVPWTPPLYTPYLPGTAGRWYQASATVAPAGYQFPAMRPYFLSSNDQFRPPPPPAFGSAVFLAALQEVRDISDHRTAEQTAIANYWNMSAGTITSLGFLNAGAGEYVAEHGWGERTASHILALSSAAAFDAVIGCWDAKYHYVFLRPSHADPLITRPIGPPGFPFNLPNHPSYPSGHSCASAAAVTVLSAFFPERRAMLEANLEQAGLSRVYGGIHYMFDVTEGQALGRSAGRWAMAYDESRGLLTAVGLH